jgi:hypothetical protein
VQISGHKEQEVCKGFRCHCFVFSFIALQAPFSWTIQALALLATGCSVISWFSIGFCCCLQHLKLLAGHDIHSGAPAPAYTICYLLFCYLLLLWIQELLHVQELLSSLPDPERQKVADIWDALLMARHDCEAMAARGVRVSRDVSRDWQETVSDLIDRVVTQDNEIANLKQQVRYSS